MGFLYRNFLGGEETLLEDILRNLGYLFSTTRGTSVYMPAFGLSSTGFRTNEEMINTYRKEIVECVRLYEPRIEIVELEEEYDDESPRPRLILHFRIKGESEVRSAHVDPQKKNVNLAPAADDEHY